MSKGTFGVVLLLVGTALGIFGGVLWRSEDTRIHKANETNALVAADAHSSYPRAVTNHAPSAALFIVSGAETLFGMLVLAGMSAGARRTWAKASIDVGSS